MEMILKGMITRQGGQTICKCLAGEFRAVPKKQEIIEVATEVITDHYVRLGDQTALITPSVKRKQQICSFMLVLMNFKTWWWHKSGIYNPVFSELVAIKIMWDEEEGDESEWQVS